MEATPPSPAETRSAPSRGVRRQRAARSRGHPRLRALRDLPAPVPDVPRAGPGDGLAARTHLPDARRHRGAHRPHRELRPPHGPLPRLPRVRDGVPGGRPVRPPASRRRAGRSSASRRGRSGGGSWAGSRSACSRNGARLGRLLGPDAALPAVGAPGAWSAGRASSGPSAAGGDGARCCRRSPPGRRVRLPAETLPRGQTTGHGRAPRGLRAGAPLSGGQPRDGLAARARRLSRRGPRGAGVLRRAPSALG